jgi:hypothetical protein
VSQAGASELHSSHRSDGAPSLDRALGLRDLVLFNLVAVLGLRRRRRAEFGVLGGVRYWKRR